MAGKHGRKVNRPIVKVHGRECSGIPLPFALRVRRRVCLLCLHYTTVYNGCQEYLRPKSTVVFCAYCTYSRSVRCPLDSLLTPRGRLICCCGYIIPNQEHVVKVCFAAFYVNMACYGLLSLYIARFLRFPLFLVIDTVKHEKTFALLYASGWNRYKMVKAGIINSKIYQHLQHCVQVSSYTIERICALLQYQPGGVTE